MGRALSRRFGRRPKRPPSPRPGGSGPPPLRRRSTGSATRRGSAPDPAALQKRRRKVSPSKPRNAALRRAHQGVAPGHLPLRPPARSGPEPAAWQGQGSRTAVAPATAHQFPRRAPAAEDYPRVPPFTYRTARQRWIRSCRSSSQSIASYSSPGFTSSSPSSSARVLVAVSACSRRHKANFQSDQSIWPATRARASCRFGLARRSRISGSPSFRIVPSTAATWPCGRVPSMWTTSGVDCPLCSALPPQPISQSLQ